MIGFHTSTKRLDQLWQQLYFIHSTIPKTPLLHHKVSPHRTGDAVVIGLIISSHREEEHIDRGTTLSKPHYDLLYWSKE